MQEKEIDQKQKRNLLSIVFNLLRIFEITEQEFLLDSRLSAWSYFNSFNESIYSRKEKQRYFCQDTKFRSAPSQSYRTNFEKIKLPFFCSAQLLGVFLKSVFIPGVFLQDFKCKTWDLST